MALLRPSSSGSPTSLVRRALSAIRSIVIPQKDCQIITSCPGALHVLPPTSFSASAALTSSPLFNGVLQEQPVFEPGHGARRGFSSSGGVIKATLFPGDGIGPEIAESVKKVTGRLSSFLLVQSFQRTILGLWVSDYLKFWWIRRQLTHRFL